MKIDPIKQVIVNSCYYLTLLACFISTTLSAQIDAMIIDEKGDVGIGTATPTSKLEIRDSNPILYLSSPKWNSTGRGSGGKIKFGDDFHYIQAQFGEGLTLHDVNGFKFTGAGVSFSAPDTTILRVQSTTGYQGNTAGIDFATFHGTGRNARIEAVDMGNWNGSLAFLTANQGKNDSSSRVTERMRISNEGFVGIGTATPTSKLEIRDSNPVLYLSSPKWNSTGRGSGGKIKFGDDNHYIQAQFDEGMTFLDNKMFNFRGGTIHVYGMFKEKLKDFGFLNESGAGHSSTYHDYNYGLICHGKIRAEEHISKKFSSESDERTKDKVVPASAKNDLSAVLSIDVVNYQYIDTIQSGNQQKKGVVAQDLEKVYPDAVTKTVDFIPNIYSFALEIKISHDFATFVMESEHRLKEGDLIKLFTDVGEIQKVVKSVENDSTFTLANWKKSTTKVFVFGKQVNDFRSVDYDQIAMLGISAIQQLHQEIEELKASNLNLKAQLNGLNELRESLANLEVQFGKFQKKQGAPKTGTSR